MLKDRIKKILTFNGIALIIGVLGSLASILSVLVTKWDTLINIKWLVFVIFISLAIILFLIKLAFDLLSDLKMRKPNTASAIRYVSDNKTLVVTQNDFLGYSAMVSILFKDDNYEVEFGKGYVENITDNFTQIKILEISGTFIDQYDKKLRQIENNDLQVLKNIVVKSYITYTNLNYGTGN